jgi:hypothetical protein
MPLFTMLTRAVLFLGLLASFAVAEVTSADVQTFLDAHNTVRSHHDGVALVWNSTVAAYAQQWADKCNMVHSNPPYGGWFPLMVLLRFTEDFPCCSIRKSVLGYCLGLWHYRFREILVRRGLWVIYLWVKGIINSMNFPPSASYVPTNPVPSHFTQVVWKSTKQLGCGVQICEVSIDLIAFNTC